MKKFIAITFCAIMTLSFVGCANTFPAKENSQKSSEGSNQSSRVNEKIPSPFIDCETMADAEKIVGFDVTLPKKMLEGYTQKLIQAVETEMIQIFYKNGEKEILIRKAKGSEDISGDYTEYKESETVAIGTLQVSTKGNDGKINVATWVDGDYSYSITANLGETGLDMSIISYIVGNIR